MRAPKTDSGSKGFHSIQLQVVCDSRCTFIDWFVGWPGSANDARVWNNSPIGKALGSNQDLLPINSHLLGDSAYPLNIYLITPYRDNGHHLTSKQKI
jgi:DDE superfamily endonuclease